MNLFLSLFKILLWSCVLSIFSLILFIIPFFVHVPFLSSPLFFTLGAISAYGGRHYIKLRTFTRTPWIEITDDHVSLHTYSFRPGIKKETICWEDIENIWIQKAGKTKLIVIKVANIPHHSLPTIFDDLTIPLTQAHALLIAA